MLSVFEAVAGELLLFAACGFLLFAVDDLLADLIWAWNHISPLRPTARSLNSEDMHLAVFVPAWQEATVIAAMLQRCIEVWDADSSIIFVGTYPNDPATREAVTPFLSPRTRLVILDHDGPTTKADCLNGLWIAMMAAEAETGHLFTGVVLHDAEDRVHKHEIDLFCRYLDQYDLIQIPVIPDPVRNSRWIAGHYLDEFAEAHQKELVVRQRIGASLPSAGTGCAISRRALSALARERGGGPFDPESLTEDYELGLTLSQRRFKSVFVRETSPATSELIAVHSCFPSTLTAATRQKTRWIIGIALAGWDRTGWHGGIAEHWMRWRDRRSVIAALVVLAAYLGLFLSLPAWMQGELPAASGILPYILAGNAIFLVWRLTMRTWFTSAQYGWSEGWRAAPRSIISNVVSVLASARAVTGYLQMLISGEVIWDKTDHRPSDHDPQH